MKIEKHEMITKRIKRIKEKQTRWTQIQLHGQFIRQKMVKASEYQWGWLRKESLKRTTEALTLATQEQVIRTNNIKAKI